MPALSPSRLRTLGPDRPVNPDGAFVLYWMTASRRLRFNPGLQHAAEHARTLGRPLVILEALRCGYPFASDRLHRFVMDGMAEHAQVLSPESGPRAVYYPYLERGPGEGRGLIEALGEHACVVVSDDFPAFFLPRMHAAAAARLRVRFELVDGNGLVPMALTPRAFPTAQAFRRFMQDGLSTWLSTLPQEDPLDGLSPTPAGVLPPPVLARWPLATLAELMDRDGRLIGRLPIDHGVPAVSLRGGEAEALDRWARFRGRGLHGYHEQRMDLVDGGGSGLSPYLHFGHVSSCEIILDILQNEEWTLERVAPVSRGQRQGFWGLSEGAEAFLDQLITWRELGFCTCFHQPEAHATYEALPEWARKTLATHAADPRPVLYTPEALSQAQTHDEVWNAAQMELVQEGRMHNYLRMLWGKKILEWSPSPRQALAVMLEQNDRFALDGRDPNSSSGILWVLGRHDRAWGPERPIFGTVRYMSSTNTRRKLDLEDYLARYSTNTRLTDFD